MPSLSIKIICSCSFASFLTAESNPEPDKEITCICHLPSTERLILDQDKITTCKDYLLFFDDELNNIHIQII